MKLKSTAPPISNVNSKSGFDLDMDSEFADKLNEMVEQEVERARESFQRTTTRRMQEMTDEFCKKVDFLRKEMFQYNSEIGAIIDIVKQDQDAALKKINKTVSEILKVNQTMADEHTKVKTQQQITMTTVTLHDSTITSLIDQATQLEVIISSQLGRTKPNALSTPLNTDRSIF